MRKLCFLAAAFLVASEGIAQGAYTLSGCLQNAAFLHRVAQLRDQGVSQREMYARIGRLNDPQLVALGDLAIDLAYSLRDHTPAQLKQFQVNECKKEFAGNGRAR